jgi:hypothetical protein
MVQTVGYVMVRSMHEAVVADVLRTFEVIVAPIGTVSTIE